MGREGREGRNEGNREGVLRVDVIDTDEVVLD